jgi:kynurenine formamidase
MKRLAYRLVVSAALIAAASALAQTPSWTPPPESARCPSKWGVADQRGAGNHMKPETVLNAVRFVKTGEVIELGHVLAPSMPLWPGRRYKLSTKQERSTDSTGFFGSNQLGANDDLIVTNLGQVGTQLDGFAHITHRTFHYNCFKADEIATASGFTKLGIENVGALIARGVLVDVAGYKRVGMLPDAYEITVADVEGALREQNVTLQPGDAILIHTGWGTLWASDNARYGKSNPGIGVKAAEWLIAKDPMVIGSDNQTVEVFPNPDPMIANPVHQMAIVVSGIHLLENMKLDELVAKRAYEFAFIVQPLKLQGATGSTVAPIAVR